MQDGAAESEAGAQARLAAQLFGMARGYQTTQLLFAAANLGLADLVATGPKSVEALAQATSTHAPSLYRLLRALASVGIFSQRDDGQIEMTPLAAVLRAEWAGSMRAQVLHQGGDMYRVWGELLHSIETGESSFTKVFGVSNWERREQHPEINANFNAAQADGARLRAISLADTYAFPQSGVVIDVGGGTGTLIAAVLSRHPGLRGVLFDQPHVVEQAANVLAAAGVADRCTAEGGDFFKAVPEGADVYILAGVLQDWDDSRALEILRQCRRAMSSSTQSRGSGGAS